MKIAIGLALALALALSSVPAIAGDTFQAFSSMPTLEQASLTPLSDEQLASIEGARARLCLGCVNIAAITQTGLNLNILSLGEVEQEIEQRAEIEQSNN
jgi:hypothetical protein